ncbi:MAG: 50S ribosomal protein L10 [bacterium]
MVRAEKEKVVQELAGKFQRAQGVYLADFTGLDVASITELRRRLRSASVEFLVVKNSLARRAVEQAGVLELRDFLVGPTCLAFGYEDPVVPARVLVGFAREHERPKIRSGLLEGRLLTAGEIGAVATLPSREELLAKIVTLTQSPLAGFVSRCRELLRKFVATVDALRAQRDNEGGLKGDGGDDR